MRLADPRRAARRQVQRARLRRGGADRLEDLEQVRLLLVDLDAAPRVRRRRARRGRRAAAGRTARRPSTPPRPCRTARPRAAPMWKTWTASPKSTSTERSGACAAPAASPRPGASTKKSSSTGSSPGGAASMYPPAPSPVSIGSATNEVNIAASAASTALPPARRMSAPAAAVTGWPAATTPRIAAQNLRDVLGHVDVDAASRPAHAARNRCARARLGPAHAADRGSPAGSRSVRPPRSSARAARGAVAVARGHDGDPHLLLELLVDHGAEDDVRLGVRGVGDGLRRLVDLPQRQVAPARDRQQDRLRALERRLQQRGRDGLRRRVRRALLAVAHADAQQRRAGLGHDRAHVGEVEVDQARERDQVRDALHALAQHVVGDPEGLHHRRLLVEHRQQLVVRHDDQRVDLVGQRLDPLLGGLRAARALEAERLGDDARRSARPARGRCGPRRARRRCRCRRPRRR